MQQFGAKSVKNLLAQWRPPADAGFTETNSCFCLSQSASEFVAAGEDALSLRESTHVCVAMTASIQGGRSADAEELALHDDRLSPPHIRDWTIAFLEHLVTARYNDPTKRSRSLCYDNSLIRLRKPLAPGNESTANGFTAPVCRLLRHIR